MGRRRGGCFVVVACLKDATDPKSKKKEKRGENGR